MGSWKSSVLALACALLLLIVGAAAWAQSSGTISGIVTDPSGAYIPGATITAQNEATGQKRATVSGSGGNYQIVSLPIGTYKVDVAAAGFQTKVVDGVRVQVAQVTAVNVQLSIGRLTDVVTVESTPPEIETGTMTVGQVINEKTVQEMPLNGRHFVDLGLLLPGSVVQPQNGFLTAPIRGQGALAFNTAGNREDTTNFMINGINLNDMSQNQITFQPSISTISEFKADNSTFSAEYGRNSGAIVNIATRSGTNGVHGEAFEYLRNDALDARNYFDNPNLPIPPFKRNQFGGAIGGPFYLGKLYDGRDRTFFYFSYEGLRQHQAVPLNAIVPTAAQRAEVTDPTSKQLLQFIPLANVPGTDNRFAASAAAPVNIDQWTMDVSHKISNSDNLHSYYALQQDLRNEPNLQLNNVPGFGDTRQARRQIFTFDETHVFGTTVVNDFRMGYNRIHITFDPIAQLDPRAYGINSGIDQPLGLPQINIQGMVNFGGPFSFPQGRGDTVVVFSNTLSYMRGKHALKFGAEGRRFDNNNFGQQIGNMTVSSWDNFAAGIANSYSIIQGGVISGVRTTGLGFFAQDNYKLEPHFTLEMGLRWDLNTPPTEVNGKFVAFDNATNSLVPVGSGARGSVYDRKYTHFGPRLGFAWDMFKDGKTALRGGYGLYYDQPVTNLVSILANNPPNAIPSTAVATASTPVLISDPLASAKSNPTLSPQNVDPLFSDSYVQAWNLNIQREIVKDVVVEIGYFGNKGTHLRMQYNINQPVNGVRPYAGFSNINTNGSPGNSTYNAMWLSANKRLSLGLQLGATYTWSHSIDYNSLNSENVTAQDSYNLVSERGSSDFDARHHFNVNFMYDLPLKGARLMEGWQLSGIVTLQSGNPMDFTVPGAGLTGLATRRPNVIGDWTVSNPGPNGWFDTAAFCVPGAAGCAGPAVFGNLGRNVVIGPGFNNVDFSVVKTTKLLESVNMQFRTEVFDLFNHPNFGQPGLVVGTSSFGKILSTRFAPGDSGSARQIQFAIKFLF